MLTTPRKRTDRTVWRGPSPTLTCGGVPAHRPGFRSGIESLLLLSTRLESQRHDRFEAFGGFRYPRVPNRVRPVDFDEPPVMVPAAPFMQNGLIEKTIHKRVHLWCVSHRTMDRLGSQGPSTHRIHSLRRGNHTRNVYFCKLHLDCSFFAAKNLSRRSIRKLQNRS